MKRSALLARAG